MLYPNEAKNRFQRATEARAAAKQKAATTVAEREAAREEQRERWTTHERGKSSGIAATKLDAATLAARDAYLNEKAGKEQATAENQIVPSLSKKEEFLLARAWADANPGWYASPYNVQVFSEIMSHFNLPANWTGFDAAFKYGTENGHFEPRVRLRGQSAVTPFRPAPKAAEPIRSGSRPVRIVRDTSPEENQRLRSLSFEDLKNEARSQMKAYNANRNRGN